MGNRRYFVYEAENICKFVEFRRESIYNTWEMSSKKGSLRNEII